MAEEIKNRLAAQILKAEMLGDSNKVSRLKLELANAVKPRTTSQDIQDSTSRHTSSRHKSGHTPSFPQSKTSSNYEKLVFKNQQSGPSSDRRVDKFIKSTSSLSDMFVAEKKLTASDEVKMYLKTSAKFSREDMDTKYFSEEIDDSQKILNHQSKRQRVYGPTRESLEAVTKLGDSTDQETCHGCMERLAKHLVIDGQGDHVYVSLLASKPFLSSLSNVIIRNKDHSCGSFVSASNEHQEETELLIDTLRKAWKSKGYRCLVMETYFRNRRPSSREPISCGKHFQIHCLPIKEKHFERSRMCFKQALQACESEWSMNKKLIQTDGRRIQRFIPKGLSYFWVCFDDLRNGFGHVIESEDNFSRYFGLEVLSGLRNKDFNPMKLNDRESFDDQFERCREFKVLYSKFKEMSND